MLLVTGASGQVGSELKNILNESAALFTTRKELDITDKEQVLEFCQTHHIKGIINCAAYTAVDKAETEVERADQVNHLAVSHLVEAMNEAEGFVLQLSTDYVFDGKAHVPYKETDLTIPQSVYGETKLLGEQVILEQATSGMIIRTSWVYSSYGHNFVKTILQLCQERDQLGIVADQVGSPTYARDLAQAIVDSISFIKPDTVETYHYSNEGVCSWYDFAKAIVEEKRLTTEINAIETQDYPTPAERPHYSVLNKVKGKTLLKWKIPYWRDSLRDCLKLL